jgi:RNA polymerase sigma-70 factor (ECF subfamily)
LLPAILTVSDSEKERAMLLYKKYVGLMNFIAKKSVNDQSAIDDIVSDSAIKMLRHLEKLEQFSCYEQQQYIVSIVKSVCVDYYRKSSKNTTEPIDLAVDHTSDEGNP